MDAPAPAFAGLHAPLPLQGTPAPSSLATRSIPARRRRRHERLPTMAAPANPAPSTLSASAPAHEAKLTASEANARQYVPLHVHSDFSLLEAASQVSSLAARAAELRVPALALTDRCVLYGAIALVRACRAAGIKPVIGSEMYLINGEPGAPADGARPARYHIVALAKNTAGYRNLVKLTTMAHLHGKVGKGIFARPCVNKANLYAHREGLIVSSGGLHGEIAQCVLRGEHDAARAVATWYRDAFGADFYLEIQDHGKEENRIVNAALVQLGRDLSIRLIATNDSHFTTRLDADAHDAFTCIQTGKTLDDESRWRHAGVEFFKSADEMRQSFVDHLAAADVDEALRNTIAVADKVEEYDLFGATRIPHYPVPDEFHGDASQYLRHIARDGLDKRLVVRQSSGLASTGAVDEYKERLEFELDMIERMGFDSYFLVVWDYIRYARDQGIPVGPGRGSVAGSLVAFALRITDVDPIAFNLLFERFLNPERRSMPDIDTDFSVDGREKVIAYVSERYGKDRVAQIITFNRLTSKAVLKDMARVHKVPYSEADKLAKLIPVIRGKPATLTQMMADDTPSPEFKELIESKPGHLEWIEKARRIEGANKTFGIHAAGVVISASPLTDAVPLSVAKHGETITQYPMEDVESMGLLKMDFLGLKNLSVIESALKFINAGRRRQGIEDDLDFSVDALPLNDANTFQLLATGELDGIFQLDASLGMRNIVRELKPASLEDISAVIALYRPGPLDAGLIPKFIRRKHGLEPIEYDHPLLEPILKDTYGIMVYQEQIMRIARDLAGYSLGQADILRRAMGKKKVKDMEKERPRFVDGAVERGVPKETAEKLFEMMIQFAEYCFNKSHSTAYAYLTYQTAYLKANYPVEYAAALLGENMSSPDKLVRYLSDANVSGVKVKAPSINRSEIGFTVQHESDGEAVVMFGLEAVKTVGKTVSEAIIKEREANGNYSGIIDLVERINSRVLNKRSMSALVLCGAFDELHPNRKVLSEQLEDLLTLRRKLRDRRKRREKKELSEEDEQAEMEKDMAEWDEIQLTLDQASTVQPDFDLLEKLKAEKSTLGFYASGHPLYDLVEYRRFLDTTPVAHVVGESHEAEDNHDVFMNDSGVRHGEEVAILSLVSELNLVKTSRGHKMAKWMAEDDQGRMQAIVFPAGYPIVEQVREQKVIVPGLEFEDDEDVEKEAEERVVEQDARVVVWGRVDRESSGNVQLFVDDVQRVEDVSIVLATARYNPDRTGAMNEAIAQRYVGEFLDVAGSSLPMSYSYQDKNGNRITRTRRPGKVDFKTKRRKPFVLRVLGEGGATAQHINLGSRFRFGDVTQTDFDSLQERTGLHFEEVNVFEYLSKESKIEVQAQAGDVAEELEEALEDAAEEAVEDAVEEAVEDAVEEAFEEAVEEALEDAVEEALEEAVEEEIGSVVDDMFGSESVERVDMGKFGEDDLIIEGETSPLDPFISDPAVPEVVRTVVKEEKILAPVASSSESEVEKPQEVEVGCSFGKEKEDDLEIILKKFGRKRSEFDYLKDHEFETLARKSVEQRAMRAKQGKTPELRKSPEPYVRKSTVARKPRRFVAPVSFQKNTLSHKSVPSETTRVLAGVSSLSGADDESSDSYLGDSFSGSPPSDGSDNGPGSPSSPFDMPISKSEFDDLLRRLQQVENRINDLESNRPSDEALGDIVDSLRVSASIVEQRTVSMVESADRILADAADDVVKLHDIVDDAPDPYVPPHATAEVVPPEALIPVAVKPINYAKEWHTTPRRSVMPSISKRDGLRISSNDSGRLLDLICYVGSDATFKHCQDTFQILLTSGFDLSFCGLEDEDELFVDISARIASVDLNCISVLVSVKESEPTGSRKSCRTLTSGVIVFRASGEAPGLLCSTNVSKKARQNCYDALESRLDVLNSTKRLGASAWGRPKRRKSKSKPSAQEQAAAGPQDAARNALHHADTVKISSTTKADLPTDALWLSDGGQLLSWMSTAAENCCLENIPDVTRSCMVSVELLHMPHTLDPECDWNEVTIRAKLSHVKGTIVVVDVAAELLKKDVDRAGSSTIQAVLRVDCSPVEAVTAVQFCESKWVPFDDASMQGVPPLIKQLCDEMQAAM